MHAGVMWVSQKIALLLSNLTQQCLVQGFLLTTAYFNSVGQVPSQAIVLPTLVVVCMLQEVV